ncbi:hypothetical protein QTQ03_16670 [Micromonospora sp. WMMA1363]|uniref:hypothetical protein n=1 Tax=Micromonospora sp. WMMA1363 TaxID=3053985 RepID=UPI00259D28B2|nr:hypothetical protein [Micromonospora sp. WMMA1363]MDM4721153.1 hypothetical protein [Micromonospora sp. WMMA1363]
MAWAPDYITSAQLKAYVRVDANDTVDDDEIADAVTAASRAVDQHTHRQFGQVAVAEARTYTAVYDRHVGMWRIVVDDLGDTTGLDIQAAGGEITTYTLHPRNALTKGRVYEEIRVPLSASVTPTGDEGELTITAPWGWPATPTAVPLATKLQGSRFLARRDSPYGVAGSPQDGSEVRLLARVDPDVAVSLRPYVRDWWVA